MGIGRQYTFADILNGLNDQTQAGSTPDNGVQGNDPSQIVLLNTFAAAQEGPVPASPAVSDGGASGTFTVAYTSTAGNSTYSSSTAVDSGASFTVNQYAGYGVVQGGNSTTVISNTATTLTTQTWQPSTPTIHTSFTIEKQVAAQLPVVNWGSAIWNATTWS